jgi:hypothetical protein
MEDLRMGLCLEFVAIHDGFKCEAGGILSVDGGINASNPGASSVSADSALLP